MVVRGSSASCKRRIDKKRERERSRCHRWYVAPRWFSIRRIDQDITMKQTPKLLDSTLASRTSCVFSVFVNKDCNNESVFRISPTIVTSIDFSACQRTSLQKGWKHATKSSHFLRTISRLKQQKSIIFACHQHIHFDHEDFWIRTQPCQSRW